MVASLPTQTGRHNNFDSLRLVAALAVLLSHSVPITYGDNQHEILHRISGGQTTIGELAVVVFFAMSGWLIAASYLRSNSAGTFIRARALRIMPALAIAVLICALAIGPMATNLTLREYLASPGTWRFIWRNLLVRQTGDLPGVFASNPIPSIINGSLWTLEYEVECYAVILLLGVCGFLNRMGALIIYGFSLCAAALWLGGEFGPLLAVFMGGAAMRAYNMPLRPDAAAICGLLWIAGCFMPGFRMFSATFGVYVVLFLALSPHVRLPSLSRHGDWSYGVYIWAFPVQQCVRMYMSPGDGWYWNAAGALPIVMGCAAFSWHFVEAPCLRLKSLRKSLPGGMVGTVDKGPAP